MLTRNHLGERKADFTVGFYSPSWGKPGQEPRIEAGGVEEHCSPDAVVWLDFPTSCPATSLIQLSHACLGMVGWVLLASQMYP